MKSSWRIIFLMITATVVVLQSVSLLYVECEFTINKKYIASVLCVNKSKPQMHCDGKCFLKKEMTRGADQQNNNQKNISSFSSIVLFIESLNQQTYIPQVLSPSSGFFLSYFSPGFLNTEERPPTA